MFIRNEILSVQWFDYEEIMERMDDKLRDLDFVKNPIKNHENNVIGSMDLVKILK